MSATRQRVVGGAAAALALVATGTLVGRAARHAGATPDEVGAHLPGDGVVVDPVSVSTRAVTLPAPPSQVWPWIVQMGWGRAGWYSLDAVEAAVGAARSVAEDGTRSWRSLHEVAPRHQSLALGDPVPLRGDLALRVDAIAPDDHLVLTLDAGGDGWSFTWVWAWVLEGDGEGSTRLLVRTSQGGRPGAVVAPFVTTVLDPGHAVMELVQLRNLRRRVVRRRRATT